MHALASPFLGETDTLSLRSSGLSLAQSGVLEAQQLRDQVDFLLSQRDELSAALGEFQAERDRLRRRETPLEREHNALLLHYLYSTTQ